MAIDADADFRMTEYFFGELDISAHFRNGLCLGWYRARFTVS
jgi:hypothetical protein